MVHKYEIAEYQGASIETLTEVAKTLNVSLDIEKGRPKGGEI